MELKANELRIGNLVYIPQFKSNFEIGTIYENGRFLTKNNKYSFSSIECAKPIPLTEEWLLKFGFRHVMNNWYNLQVNGNTFNIYIFEDKRYKIEIVSQSIGVFEFVHNLQNLYFALTNKELEIKM